MKSGVRHTLTIFCQLHRVSTGRDSRETHTTHEEGSETLTIIFCQLHMVTTGRDGQRGETHTMHNEGERHTRTIPRQLHSITTGRDRETKREDAPHMKTGERHARTTS